MRFVDLIAKKRDGIALTTEEIQQFIDEYTHGKIPDYQVSALLMAICLRGMDQRETTDLTMAMARSGETLDLSSLPGVKVDKHSTGGVGDKTTLVVAPLVASMGVPVAKMSGRGLGHTGGTIDKLESIPGVRTTLSRDAFLKIMLDHGVCIAGQSGNLAPADKKLYALRDVTATVASDALIAASVMSKKIASGADAIVLDVKVGSGAFLKTFDQASALAKEMVRIGEEAGRSTVALITNMDQPIGFRIGNNLEVSEAVQALRGTGAEDLTQLSVEIASNMLDLAGKYALGEARQRCLAALRDGSAFAKFLEMIEAQGGDVEVLTRTDKFVPARYSTEIRAPKSGYLARVDCQQVGIASMLLGAGREAKDVVIDYSAGIVLHHRLGDSVRMDEPIARLCTNNPQKLDEAGKVLAEAYTIGETQPAPLPLIYARVDKHSI